MFDLIAGLNATEVLNILKTGTWIATGISGVAGLLCLFRLFTGFKTKSKEQKVKDFMVFLMPVMMIGVFWCTFFIWGESIAAGYV